MSKERVQNIVNLEEPYQENSEGTSYHPISRLSYHNDDVSRVVEVVDTYIHIYHVPIYATILTDHS